MEDQLQSELQFHLEREIEENIIRGMTPEEARSAALRSFGGVEQIREQCRDVRGVRLYEEIWQDLRYGLRMLRKNSGFTLTSVTTLALGIGANTAIFSAINAVLLSPLPYQDAERIVDVASTMRRETIEIRSPSYPDFVDWRDQSTVFEQLAAHDSTSFTLTGGAEPERVNGELVSASYFPLLRVRAVMGRTFLPEEDDTPDTHRVALVGYGLWQRRFGGSPDLVGRTIRLNDGNYTVVGIMPEAFRGISDQAEIWLPMMMVSSVRYAAILREREQRWLSAVGRLKPGVTLVQAQSEMDTIAGRLEQAYPTSNRNRGARVTPLHEQFFGGLQLILWILLGAVGCVLLVACANVANLQLQRAAGRTQEMAIRLALGATPRRLIRQLLTESLLLSLIGGTLGVSLASWSMNYLIKLSPVTFPSFVNLTLDARVLCFSLLLSISAGALSGLAPALQAAWPALSETLKAGGRNASGGLGRSCLLASLVVSEIALALALLISAGLMIRSLQRLQAVDPGFNSERLLTMRVSLPSQRYQRDQLVAFSRQLRERLEALPGVQSVAMASDLPLSGIESAGPIESEGLPVTSAGGEIRMYRHRVSPEFFSTLGIRLVKGRDFTDDDHALSPGVVIISEAMARRYWPKEDPIGKHLRETRAGAPSLSIIGIVREVKYRGLPQNPNPDPDVYFPLQQAPADVRPRDRNLSLAVRTGVDPAGLVAGVRAELQKLDPDLPAYSVSTMAQQVAGQTAQSRFSAWLLGIFGALALVLAAVGIYSVMAYAVEQRAREIGVALGARSVDVLKMVMAQGMRLALLGVALGLGATLALAQLMKRLLFGVAAADPLTYGSIALLLTSVALFACWIPARRVTKIDPMITLKYE